MSRCRFAVVLAVGAPSDRRGIRRDGVSQRFVLRAWHDLGQPPQMYGGVGQQRVDSVRVRSRSRQTMSVHHRTVQVGTRPRAQYDRRRIHLRPVLYAGEPPGQTASGYQLPENRSLQV